MFPLSTLQIRRFHEWSGGGRRSSAVRKLQVRELGDEPPGVVGIFEINRGGRGADALSGVPRIATRTQLRLQPSINALRGRAQPMRGNSQLYPHREARSSVFA